MVAAANPLLPFYFLSFLLFLKEYSDFSENWYTSRACSAIGEFIVFQWKIENLAKNLAKKSFFGPIFVPNRQLSWRERCSPACVRKQFLTYNNPVGKIISGHWWFDRTDRPKSVVLQFYARKNLATKYCCSNRADFWIFCSPNRLLHMLKISAFYLFYFLSYHFPRKISLKSVFGKK